MSLRTHRTHPDHLECRNREIVPSNGQVWKNSRRKSVMLQKTSERQQDMSIVYLPRFDQRLIPLVVGAPRLHPECTRWTTTSRIVDQLPPEMTDPVADSAWTVETLICLVRRHHGRIDKPRAWEIVYGLAADLTDGDILRRIAHVRRCQMSQRSRPEVLVDLGHQLTVDGK